MIPQDLRYTKEHEWIRLTDDRTGVVGITEFAANQLGSVVMVELPEERDRLEKGQPCGSLESTKAVADLYAPVSGIVLRVNTPLGDTPEYVNDDPYDEGWLMVITLSDLTELDDLMDATAYAAYVAENE